MAHGNPFHLLRSASRSPAVLLALLPVAAVALSVAAAAAVGIAARALFRLPARRRSARPHGDADCITLRPDQYARLD